MEDIFGVLMVALGIGLIILFYFLAVIDESKSNYKREEHERDLADLEIRRLRNML